MPNLVSFILLLKNYNILLAAKDRIILEINMGKCQKEILSLIEIWHQAIENKS